MDEGFFEEVTFKLRAQQVKFYEWEKSLTVRGCEKRLSC